MTTFERRSFARIHVGIEAVYKQDGQASEKSALIKDISLSGIKIVVNDDITEGNNLDIVIHTPAFSEPMAVRGRLVWKRQLTQSFSEAGLEFTEISKDQQSELGEYIKKSLFRLQEQRRFLRCPLSVRLQYGPPEEVPSGKGLTIDISPSGLKAYFHERVEAHTCLQLQLKLSGTDRTIEPIGEVIWIKRDITGNFWETGIEFTSIPDPDVDLISEYITKTLNTKP